MNPYGFVRLADPAGRESVRNRGHDRFVGLSGTIFCRLTAETHLFIPGYRAESAGRNMQHSPTLRFCRSDQTPIIPGTSLKGMVRSVAEAVSGSCFIYDMLEYERGAAQYDLPAGHRHCDDTQNLCPACRMFGLLNRGTVFGGLVTVSDARSTGSFETETFTLGILSTPKPRHRAFYGQAGAPRRPQGRKFYYHHSAGWVVTRTIRDNQNKTVEAARPGATFTFAVEYTNLTNPELALLLYALGLETNMRHKIGMGKPIGLGSVHIEITGWRALDRAARYRTFGGGTGETLEGDAAAQAIAAHIGQHGSAILRSPAQADLRRIWTWPPPVTAIVYPTRAWFDEHIDTSLEGAP